MRPGQYSEAGFLGENEGLLAVMVADNEYVVDDLGLSHQDLAKHLYNMAAICAWQSDHDEMGMPFLYHGRRYFVWVQCWNDDQPSPFDDATATNSDVTVTNLDNRKELWFSLLVPMMIDRYGFYEGRGTKYRVEPRQVLEVFDFLRNPGTLSVPRLFWGTIVLAASALAAGVVGVVLSSRRRNRPGNQANVATKDNLPGDGAAVAGLPPHPLGSDSSKPLQPCVGR